MLIRFDGPKRFIFVANTRTASNSIEGSRFADYSQIRISSPAMGKHLWIDEILDRFGFVFDRCPREQFFVFGVLRDPVEWVMSWYDYNSRPELAVEDHPNHGSFCGDIGFEEFWNRYGASRMLQPQSRRFLVPDDETARADFLIRFDHLEEDLGRAAAVLGLGRVRLLVRNRAPHRRIRSQDIDPSTLGRIRQQYRVDEELLAQIESFNDAGIDRYQARTHTDGDPVSPVVGGLQRAVRSTRLEQPARSVAAMLGIGSKRA